MPQARIYVRPRAALLIRPYEPRDREALLALRGVQEDKWYGSRGNMEGFEPTDRALAFMYVLEDDGRLIAAIGVKHTAEIRMVLDPAGRDLATLIRKDLMPLWAKTVAELHRRGFPDCYAFVPNVIRKWGNSLVRRAGFKRERTPAFCFNVREAVKAINGPH
jgi:hypothetical protein